MYIYIYITNISEQIGKCHWWHTLLQFIGYNFRQIIVKINISSKNLFNAYVSISKWNVFKMPPVYTISMVYIAIWYCKEALASRAKARARQVKRQVEQQATALLVLLPLVVRAADAFAVYSTIHDNPAKWVARGLAF